MLVKCLTVEEPPMDVDLVSPIPKDWLARVSQSHTHLPLWLCRFLSENFHKHILKARRVNTAIGYILDSCSNTSPHYSPCTRLSDASWSSWWPLSTLARVLTSSAELKVYSPLSSYRGSLRLFPARCAQLASLLCSGD